jgi:hypothetical protein
VFQDTRSHANQGAVLDFGLGRSINESPATGNILLLKELNFP